MDFSEIKEIKDNFVQELKDASSGKPTSIPFIVHEMPSFSLLKDGESFQVIVIGGTYASSAIVQKNGEKYNILSNKNMKLPTLANKEDFLIFVERVLDPTIQIVVLNFAYPIIPVFEDGKLDGKLLRGTKGHTFRGLVGKKVGGEVEKYMAHKKKQKLSVSAANDTVFLLLSGLEKIPWDALGAGIVGTGMNFAFYLSKNKLVSLESADFNKFAQSETGIEIDEESANPGKSTYEKEVAGVYLYKHFNKMLRIKNIPHPSVKTTEELDKIAKKNKDAVGDLARMLLERSAQLIACQVAAIMEFRKTDMTFVMEGSLFWKAYKYKETVKSTVKKLTSYEAKFIEIKDSGIIGAAHLVA